MASIAWKTAASGTWSLASNWSGGLVPGGGDDVTIAAGGAAYLVTIGGAAAAASLALNSSSATLGLTGTLSLGGRLALSAGMLNLSGRINGGTLSQTGGQITALGGTLSGMTLAGPVSLTSSVRSTLHVANGMNFTGASGVGTGQVTLGIFLALDDASTTLNSVTMTLSSGLGTLYAGSNALTLGAASQLIDSGGGAVTAGTLTLQGNVTASGTGGLTMLQASSIANSGNIAVSNGSTLFIGASRSVKLPGLVINTGTISATGSNTLLEFDAASGSKFGLMSVSNGATLEITGSVVYRNSGTNTLALPGTLKATNAVLALGGTINNTGTLVLGPTGNGNTLTGVVNSFGESGATVRGGTVIDTYGTFRVSSLSNVRYQGTLALGLDFSPAVSLTGSTVLLNADGTAGGVLDLIGKAATVSLDGARAFAQGGELRFDGLNQYVSLTGTLINNVRITTGVAATNVVINGGTAAHDLTLGAGNIVIDGYGHGGFTFDLRASSGAGGGSLTNAGTMILTASANQFNILTAGDFTNSGSILIANGERALFAPVKRFVNTGSITVTGTGSTLVLDPGSWAAGSRIALRDGALLQLYRSSAGTYGVTGTNTFSFGADVDNQGGTLALGGTILNSGTISTGSTLIGAAPTVIGGSLVDAGGRFAIGGTLTSVTDYGGFAISNTSERLTLGGTVTVYGATAASAGTIAMSGSFVHLDLAGGSLALANGGTILLDGAGSAIIAAGGASNVVTSTIDQGVLRMGLSSGPAVSLSVNANAALVLGKTQQVLIANPTSNTGFYFFGTNSAIINTGTISLTGTQSYLSVRAYLNQSTNSGTLRNRGLISLSNASTVSVTTADFANYGTLRVSGAGSLFDLGQAHALVTSTGGTLTGGRYVVQSGGQIRLPDGQTITTLSANVSLSGATSEIYSVSGGATVTLAQSLSSISAARTLTLSNSHDFTAAHSLSVSGTIALSGVTLSAPGLTIAAGGAVSGTGSVVAASLVDNGTLQALGGTLSVTGSLSGSGSLAIGDGATLRLSAGSAARANFIGGGATLGLAAPSSFSGTLIGFSANDRLDLGGVNAISASASGTLLTVLQSGGPSLTFLLASPLKGLQLAVSSDGSGGSYVTALAAASLSNAAQAGASLSDLAASPLAGTQATATSSAGSPTLSSALVQDWADLRPALLAGHGTDHGLNLASL